MLQITKTLSNLLNISKLSVVTNCNSKCIVMFANPLFIRLSADYQKVLQFVTKCNSSYHYLAPHSQKCYNLLQNSPIRVKVLQFVTRGLGLSINELGVRVVVCNIL